MTNELQKPDHPAVADNISDVWLRVSELRAKHQSFSRRLLFLINF